MATRRRPPQGATSRVGQAQSLSPGIAAIEPGTRVLRLPAIRDRFTDTGAAAQRQQLSNLGVLAELVMAERNDSDHAAP